MRSLLRQFRYFWFAPPEPRRQAVMDLHYARLELLEAEQLLAQAHGHVEGLRTQVAYLTCLTSPGAEAEVEIELQGTGVQIHPVTH